MSSARRPVLSTDNLCVASSLKVAKSLKSELNIWYMDDGLGGDVDVLLDDLETVRKVGSNLGSSIVNSYLGQRRPKLIK